MNREEFNKYFSNQLTLARTKENLKQTEVAKSIDVANNSTIGRYENGDREPNLYNFYQMMLLYKTDANFYFPIKAKGNNSIPVFTTLEDVKDIYNIKKASDMLDVSSDLINCFAFIVNNDDMSPLCVKNDIVIFEKVTDIQKDGIYLLKIKNTQGVIIRNIVINNNSYILYSNILKNKPIVVDKNDIIPIGKAKELRHTI